MLISYSLHIYITPPMLSIVRVAVDVMGVRVRYLVLISIACYEILTNMMLIIQTQSLMTSV